MRVGAWVRSPFAEVSKIVQDAPEAGATGCRSAPDAPEDAGVLPVCRSAPDAPEDAGGLEARATTRAGAGAAGA